MIPLLGSFARVVSASNRSMIGLEGLVIKENPLPSNNSILLLIKDKVKLIDNAMILCNDKFVNLTNRNTKGLKIGHKFTLI